MACFMKNHRGLHYPGITANFFFGLKVVGSNPRPAKSNLYLRTGYNFPSNLQK